MHFSKKSINKTIASIDRYFTWDNRDMKVGNSIWAANYDKYAFVSFKPFSMDGWYWFYYKNGHKTYSKIIKTCKDLNEINKLIKVMF